MKVAFVTKNFPSAEVGGAGTSSKLIVEGLRKRGIDVDVFTRSGTSFQQLSPNRYDVPDGRELFRWWSDRKLSRNIAFYRSVPEFGEYDIVHVYGPSVLPAAVLKADAKVVGTFNGLSWLYGNGTAYLRRGCPKCGFISLFRNILQSDTSSPLVLPKWALEVGGRYIAQQADAFTVQNSGMKRVLESCGYREERIHVVPNLSDPSFKVPEQKSEKNIIFAGRLIPRKGPLRIAEAFSHLPLNLRESWKLNIYGEGELEEPIERLGKDRNANISVDYIPYERLPEKYASAEIFIHGSTYPEPFARSWMEAMVSGTAIICSDNPSSRAVLENVAEFYSPFSEESLIDALKTVMSNSSYREKMKSRGRERVKAFKPKKVIPKYVDVYNTVLD